MPENRSSVRSRVVEKGMQTLSWKVWPGLALAGGMTVHMWLG